MTEQTLSAAAEPLVLGIESSCDETGIGIVRGTRLLTNTVSSSMEEHVRFGGVIPEIASRAHLDAMIPALEAALADAHVTLDDIDAIAVTAGPGLAGALMVGVSAAKALATATGKPLYGINHLVAHVGVGLLDDNGTEEAYDKVARLLGLDYPGGPAIDRAARTGNAKAFVFPRGLSNRKFMGTAEAPGAHRYNFSFSGLKTAVARVIEGFEARGEEVPVADIAASFQEAVVDVITKKAVLACQEQGLHTLLLGGGVAANSRLRELLSARCASAGVRLIIPKFTLCTDNGAMVAALGARLVEAGYEPSGIDFTTDSSLPVTTVCF